MYTDVCVCMCVYIYIYNSIQHIYIYIYIYIHIHTYTKSWGGCSLVAVATRRAAVAARPVVNNSILVMK